MKKIAWFFMGIGIMFSSESLWAQASPLPMLQDTASHIVAILKEHRTELKQNHRIIYQAVEHYLLPHVDVNGMSRSVLGREAWNKASLAERQAFTLAFTQLVIRTYASPLAEYTDEKVSFLPMRSAMDGRFTRVNSVIIRSSGPSIPLSYSLVSKNNDWKIYDLSVEGVSLLQSFRSQFGSVLQHASVSELIAEMRKNKAA